MKTSLITGISGQDGAYLAKQLLGQDHRVVGVLRKPPPANGLPGLNYLGIADRILLEAADLTDRTQVAALLELVRPDEIYNLAAQSSVGQSFALPAETLEFNIVSVLNLLEVIRTKAPRIRFFQASSCEMFGTPASLPITEETTFQPLNPYGVSKASAHWLVRNYREAYGLFAASGILCHHESPLRAPNSFVKKVLRESLAIARGEQRELRVGNIEIRRDFGYAPRYVEAMPLMLQQERPDDYLICSGRSIRLREIIEFVFAELNLPSDRLMVDPALCRQHECQNTYGCNRRAREQLGWIYDLDFFDILRHLLQEERQWIAAGKTSRFCGNPESGSPKSE